MESERKPNDRSFIATVIIVIGIAWMSLTGLCTVAITFSDLSEGGSLPEILLFGAICFFPGFLIWSLGQWLRGRKRRAAQDPSRG